LLSRLFRLFAASLVPGGGYLIDEWSAATSLALYFVDNVVGSIAMALRIVEHRRLTNAAGHGRAQLGVTMTTSSEEDEQQVKFKSFLSEFLAATSMFGIGHGLFLAFVLGFVLRRPDVDDLRQGAIVIVLCHAIAVTVDRFTIQSWPFVKLKDQAERLMGRVALVNIALIGGTWFMVFNNQPDSFFKVFVWLKAAADIGNLLPSMKTREAPRPLVWLMNLFPKQNGETFEEYWRRTHRSKEEQAAIDEQARPEQATGVDETPVASRRERGSRKKRR
jgi:hypothetical protein